MSCASTRPSATRLDDLVDWEMSSDAVDFARIRAQHARTTCPVASYHNFQATPDAAWLTAKFAEAERLRADVAKIAVMPQGPQDVLTLLAATHAASQTVALPLISMSMGAYGSLSRMVGWVFGSTVTFAVGKGSSAPGQVPIDDLGRCWKRHARPCWAASRRGCRPRPRTPPRNDGEQCSGHPGMRTVTATPTQPDVLISESAPATACNRSTP